MVLRIYFVIYLELICILLLALVRVMADSRRPQDGKSLVGNIDFWKVAKCEFRASKDNNTREYTIYVSLTGNFLLIFQADPGQWFSIAKEKLFILLYQHLRDKRTRKHLMFPL